MICLPLSEALAIINPHIANSIYEHRTNITERNHTYGDFKSNPRLGERKCKKLKTVSTFLRKDIALV